MRWSAGPGATASPTKPSSREASNPIAQLHNLSDERTVEQWTLNPCFQFFCGEREFQWSAPCAASELVHFRDRIGPAGGEKLLTASIALHGARAKDKEVVLDTTAQEKAITFPTDAKLHAKVIKTARRVAAKDGNALCQSYARTVSKLLQAERGWRHPRTLAITMGAVAILLTLLWVNAPEPGSAGQATGDKGPVTGTGIPGDAR
ncbi:MAG: transposase, partial [Verrucomicrobia bacterium]|nr:transposase [Verrucomicrobiota bacterium]